MNSISHFNSKVNGHFSRNRITILNRKKTGTFNEIYLPFETEGKWTLFKKIIFNFNPTETDSFFIEHFTMKSERNGHGFY